MRARAETVEKAQGNNRTPTAARCCPLFLSSSRSPNLFLLSSHLSLSPTLSSLATPKTNTQRSRARTSAGSSGASPGPSTASPTPRRTRRRLSSGESVLKGFEFSLLSLSLEFFLFFSLLALSPSLPPLSFSLNFENQTEGRRPPSTTTSSTRRSTSLVRDVFRCRKPFFILFLFLLFRSSLSMLTSSLLSFFTKKLLRRHQDGLRRAQEAPGPHGPDCIPQELDVVKRESCAGRRGRKKKLVFFFFFLLALLSCLLRPAPAKGTAPNSSPPPSKHHHFLCLFF